MAPKSVNVPSHLKDALSAAEKQAAAFNKLPKAKRQNAVQQMYQMPKFDFAADVQEQRNLNLIDQEWADTTIQEFNTMTPAEKEQAALQATGFTAEAKAMEPASTDVSPEENQEEAQKPLTEDEAYALVAKQLDAQFPTQSHPAVEHLKGWKQAHGNIFILNMGGEHLFIYRYLKRQELLQLQAEKGWAELPEHKQEERIVDKCLLFPKYQIEAKGALPAGMYSMLAEQIHIQSMFLNPVQVANVTMKI